MYTEIDYLGYNISDDGVRPTKSGVEAVINYPVPKSPREVMQFIGLCSYFRKYIKNFSIIAKPLYDLTKKNIFFKFGKEELDTFESLKSKLLEAPVLSI